MYTVVCSLANRCLSTIHPLCTAVNGQPLNMSSMCNAVDNNNCADMDHILTVRQHCQQQPITAVWLYNH
jgi:hypothetical protein